jgi:hypothetical protein
MAVILDAMGPYMMQLIANMAKEEVNILLGISGGIEKLENNMESLKCFLADGERKHITELSVQRWVHPYIIIVASVRVTPSPHAFYTRHGCSEPFGGICNYRANAPATCATC